MAPDQPNKFLVGTSGWSYPHWQGIFYPDDLPQSKWLDFYTEHFSAVEINATFYRFFEDKVFHKWRQQVPHGFRYVLKAPRVITHRKFLQDSEEEIHKFWRSASLLDDKLGLILLQLAPQMSYDPERLRRTLLMFEQPNKIAVEFRNRKWLTQDTQTVLSEVGAVFCTADSPRSELSDWVTSGAAYVRLHGRQRWYSYDYNARELREIAELAERMNRKGAKVVYVFFNNDFDGHAPRNAKTLMEILR